MKFIKNNWLGILITLVIAVPCYFLGNLVPVVGGAVFAIVLGMIIGVFWQNKGSAAQGIKWTSKYILQAAVVLLGFGMNLSVVAKTGLTSLPIIVSTISTALILAFVFSKILKIKGNTATLVGVGSSICGGSAIAATAPVIGADDDEVAQSISVIFFFNVIAALLFPTFGRLLGFAHEANAFGVFAGTAVNDTSSVTAAASSWDSMWNLGTKTLDIAATVKLTRTLAIIPITLVLAIFRARKTKKEGGNAQKFSFRRAFPMFILFFVLASGVTTICGAIPAIADMSKIIFGYLKDISKFFIIMAMGAIGLNTNVVKLIKTGGKPILLGGICWVGITGVSLLMQHVMGIW